MHQQMNRMSSGQLLHGHLGNYYTAQHKANVFNNFPFINNTEKWHIHHSAKVWNSGINIEKCLPPSYFIIH